MTPHSQSQGRDRARAPENKAAPAPTPMPAAMPTGGLAKTVADTFDDFMRAFEAYKASNDQRLTDIENRVSSDVLTEEKMRRIDAMMDGYSRQLREHTLAGRRPALGTSSGRYLTEHKMAFDAYVRKGDAHALEGYQSKSLSVGTPGDGGYFVPDETEAAIMMRLAAISPIRSIAGVRQVSGSVYKKPFSTTGPATGWVAETAARPETTSPPLAELSYPTMELYAMPAATATLLDDAIVDIDQWIAQEIEQAFAEQEGAAFITGNGIDRPKGFLTYPTVAETGWSWGKVGYVPTGVDAAFPATNPSDVLIDLIYALKAGYRQNAQFVMNRKSQSEIRKLKDADGNYLWQPPTSADGISTLMQFPIVEAEDMPDIGTDTNAVAFGDFQRGYLIVDRAGVRVLRDPYSAKPYVLFYTTKRVGGGMQDFDAIKFLKFGVS